MSVNRDPRAFPTLSFFGAGDEASNGEKEPNPWAAFSSGNMLKAPQRLKPTNIQLEAERPPVEAHAQQVADYAQGAIGEAPTEKETAIGIEQAAELRRWIEDNRNALDFHELEQRIYQIGLLSLWWRLSGKPEALREFLGFMRDWQDEAGPEAITAMTRVERKETAEWYIVGIAIHDMERKADEYNSPRLREAAGLMRAMLTPEKLHPSAPIEQARTQGATKAANTRHGPRQAIRALILAALQEMPAKMSKNERAARIAPEAFKWNAEAGNPFTWREERQAEEYARGILKPSKSALNRGAMRA